MQHSLETKQLVEGLFEIGDLDIANEFEPKQR
jgi:hypothetical protein